MLRGDLFRKGTTSGSKAAFEDRIVQIKKGTKPASPASEAQRNTRAPENEEPSSRSSNCSCYHTHGFLP